MSSTRDLIKSVKGFVFLRKKDREATKVDVNSDLIKVLNFSYFLSFPFDLDLTSFEVITEAHRNGFA